MGIQEFIARRQQRYSLSGTPAVNRPTEDFAIRFKPSVAPEGYCCIDAYMRVMTIRRTIYNTIWTQQTLPSLYQAKQDLTTVLDHVVQHEAPNLYEQANIIKTDVTTIEKSLADDEAETVVRTLQRPQYSVGGIMKKTAIGLLISFLSVSTVRYWMNVVYPNVQEYGLRKAIFAKYTPSKPSPPAPVAPPKRLDEILGSHNNTTNNNEPKAAGTPRPLSVVNTARGTQTIATTQ
ncbi:TPA: hypothetical protein HA251_04350 [Candidatus Woesearchaeota archaeon]|nr:hypothetical protein [Candidatus Woesearchaeota archaeon]